jgi:hypothetical protein
VEVRVWESKLASFGFMGVKFWLQNLHAQFTERSVPVIFSSMLSTMFPLAQMPWAHSPSKACNFIVQWINT